MLGQLQLFATLVTLEDHTFTFAEASLSKASARASS